METWRRGEPVGELIGRGEAARRLDVSVPTLRRMERANRLRSTVGPRGAHLYAAASVEALARERLDAGMKIRRPIGDIAAEAFELFARGCSVPQAVRKLRQSPAVIRSLLQEFTAGYGDPSEMRRRLAHSSHGVDEDLERLEIEIARERAREITRFELQMKRINRSMEREYKREGARASRRRDHAACAWRDFWRRRLRST